MSKKPTQPDREDDRMDRIRDLQQRAEELAGGELLFEESEDLPTELQEQFWEQIVAFEEAEQVMPFDLLVRGGMELPAPEALDDSHLATKLWEVIRGLAMLRIFLYHTGHLSDRELYEELWHEILREEGPDIPVDNDSAWHFDLLGSGSEEDNEIYLRYYADAKERREWAERWPGDPMPDAEPLPYDRDRHLPKRDQAEWEQPTRPS